MQQGELEHEISYYRIIFLGIHIVNALEESEMQVSTDAAVVRIPKIQVMGEKIEEVQKTPGTFKVLSRDELVEIAPVSSQDAVKRTAGANVIEAEGIA